MIRKALKGVVLVFLCVCVFSYLNYLRTGQFWWPQLSGIQKDVTQRIENATNLGTKPKVQTLSAPTENLYKWREKGKWVYGDKPPKNVKVYSVYEDVK